MKLPSCSRYCFRYHVIWHSREAAILDYGVHWALVMSWGVFECLPLDSLPMQTYTLIPNLPFCDIYMLRYVIL